MSDSIWATLSVIDCSDHIEKKGQFSYLAWTWAWAKVKEVYPLSTYALQEDIVYPDGTMEVRVLVSIMENQDTSMNHTMWLPVLNHQNKAIQHPNAFDINSARMRCLVKCLAMFGLGHYIYAGESAPQAPGLSDDEYQSVLNVLAEKDGIALLKLQEELGEDKMKEAFNRPERGKKGEFKESMRQVERAGHNAIDEYVTALAEHVDNQDESGVLEIAEELADDPWLKKRAWARLTEIQQHQVTTIVRKAA